MPANDWEFRWVEHDGVTYPLNCIDERKISFKLNAAGTCELKVPLRSDAGRQIATSDDGWGRILAYKGGTLRMVLESISTDAGPASEEGIPSVAIVGTEAAYIRAAGTLLTGTNPFTFPASTQQVGLALVNLISGSSATWGIGIDLPGVTSNISPSSFDQGIYLLQFIQMLAFRGSGFDFRFNPHFEDVGGGQYIVGKFQPAGTIGITRTDSPMEYGAGTKANLADYSWKRLAGEHLVNHTAVPPTGDSSGNAAGVAAAADLTSIGRYGMRSAWISADFPDKALRQVLADTHLLYRKQPRRVLSITPTPDTRDGRVPIPLTDYAPGDAVPVVIKDDGVTVVSGNLRIYSINFTIDKDGKESVELETSPETSV